MRLPARYRQVPGAVTAAFVLLIAAVPPGAEPRRDANSYYNQKYGFTLTVPSDVLIPGKARNPDVGAVWESRDGLARLLAVASENTSGETLATYRIFLMQEMYKGATIEYAPVRDKWFVLSGRMDGLMFYERITFACDGRYIYGWQLTYPIAERQRYDRIVEAIHRSYRPGRGEDGRCGKS